MRSLLLVLIGLASCLGTTAPVQALPLTIDVIDVGLGEAILIGCPDGHSFSLIDAGDSSARYPNAEEQLRTWLELHMGEVRVLYRSLATHAHPDHIAGYLALFNSQFSSKLHVDNGDSFAGADTEEQLRALLSLRGIKYASAIPARFSICPDREVRTDIIALSDHHKEALGCPSDLNNCSIVMRIEYHKKSVLLLGDVTTTWEDRVLHDPSLAHRLRAQVLKIGHHASDASTSLGLLEAVNPEYAVLSTGKPGVGRSDELGYPFLHTVQRISRFFDARYGYHPDKQAIAACRRMSKDCYWQPLFANRRLLSTSAHGTVRIAIDEKSLRVSGTHSPR